MFLDNKFPLLLFRPPYLASGLRSDIETPPAIVFGKPAEFGEIG
jgi:hypothetical protein